MKNVSLEEFYKVLRYLKPGPVHLKVRRSTKLIKHTSKDNLIKKTEHKTTEEIVKNENECLAMLMAPAIHSMLILLF